MPITDKPPPWRGIVLSISNGGNIEVSIYNITPAELTNLFYAALENIPHAPIAMTLALDKYNKTTNDDQ